MIAFLDRIRKLHKQSSKPLLAFIGSGLSIPEPTSLPSCRELIKSLLRLDWVEGGERFPISEDLLDSSTGEKLLSIRLEHALSIFVEWRKHDIAKLLSQFGDAEPNEYHHGIARLCDDRIIDSIITTNFDQCLEKALTTAGVIYKLIVEEDNLTDNMNDGIPLFKIHGSISGKKKPYKAVELKATIQAVHNGLAPWKQVLLNKLLNTHTLVTLGYGGADSYDINPIILAHNDLNLFWVAHSTQVEGFLSDEAKNLLQNSAYKKPLFIDTAVFLELSPICRREQEAKILPSFHTASWYEPGLVVGRLLEEIREFEDALNYYEHLLENVAGRVLMTEKLRLMHRKAICLYELKRYIEAQWELISCELELKGYVERMQNDPNTPKEFWKILIPDQMLLLSEERALVGAQLAEREEALAQIQWAFKYLNVSPHLSDEDQKDIEGRLRQNRANILRILARKGCGLPGDVLLACQDYDHAASLKREAGDGVGLFYGLKERGMHYLSLGDMDTAVDILVQTIKELKSLGSPIGIDMWLSMAEQTALTAFVLLDTRDYESIQYYDDSPQEDRDALLSYIVEILQQTPINEHDSIIEVIVRDPVLYGFVKKHGNPKSEPTTISTTHTASSELANAKVWKIASGKYGVKVITTADRIETQMEMIRAAGGGYTEPYSIVANCWETIGREYERAGARGAAILSYKTALELVKKCPIPEHALQDNVEWLTRLQDKIDSLAI